MSNKNALSSYAQHSTPMSMMGPAAVSTLQRKPSESVNEVNINRTTQKPFDPNRNISGPMIPSTTSDVISAMSAKSVSSQSNTNFIPSITHINPPSDTLQNGAIISDLKNTTTASSTTSSTIESPKQQKKLKHLIFSGKNLKKLVSKHKESDSMTYHSGLTGKSKDSIESNESGDNNTSKRNDAKAMAQAAMDDRHRRKFFSHHDISSLCASLGGIAHAARAKEALERRNTTTGASAASAALRSSHNDGVNSSTDSSDVDHGDNVSNELVLR